MKANQPKGKKTSVGTILGEWEKKQEKEREKTGAGEIINGEEKGEEKAPNGTRKNGGGLTLKETSKKSRVEKNLQIRNNLPGRKHRRSGHRPTKVFWKEVNDTPRGLEGGANGRGEDTVWTRGGFKEKSFGWAQCPCRGRRRDL